MNSYKYGDMVFAKCQNYPYWPGKVISVLNGGLSYKVLFYGQKSEATINQNHIVPFNMDTHKKFAQQPIAKSNKALKFSMKVAMNRYTKRKKGANSQSDQEEIYESSEYKKEEPTRKSKIIAVAKQPQDPCLQLSNLLDLLASEASSYKEEPRKMTTEQQNRLKELINNGAGMMLAELIDRRIMDRYIVVLKQLDLWGVKGSLSELHHLISQKLEEYRSIILGPQFASIPMREAKRERIMQKFAQNKAVL